MGEVMGRAWAVRRTDTGEWWVSTPMGEWKPDSPERWSNDFNDAYFQCGEGHREELYKIAERLRARGFEVETVRLGFVEDPYRFQKRGT